MDALLQSLSQYCNQDVHGAEVSSADLTGQGSASKFTYMVFGRIWTEPLRFSLIILARSLSHFPCPVGLSSILACFIKARETEVERVCWQDESHSLLIRDHKGDIPSPLPQSIGYKQDTRFSPLSRQEDDTKVQIPAVEMTVSHIQSYLPHHSYKQNSSFYR